MINIKKIHINLHYFLLIVFFSNIIFENILFSEQTETIIIKIKQSDKNKNLILSENLIPAISLSSKTKKINSLLQGNTIANELFDELRSYYYIKVPKFTAINKINELRAKKQDMIVYKSINYKIEQDKIKTNDPLYKSQWSMPIIQIENAWNKATGKGIVVGIIDTGIDYEHEDLENQLWINSFEDLNGNGKFDNWSYKEERNGVYGDIDGIDNDGNGFIDDIIGYDFVDKTIMYIGDVKYPDYLPYDENKHGTAVSSLISAEHNNKKGITGIAFDAKIMALRAFDVGGNAECKDIANAIVYAAINGADVINMSFGEYMSSPIMHTAIKFADALGCILIASAGNDGITKLHYPSSYSEVISVGGCNEDLKQIYNYGNNLNITAPAKNIYTAIPKNNYAKLSGTSFSAPIVSGISALLKEVNQSLTTKDVINILNYSATKVFTGWTPEYGAGIVNAYQALKEPEMSDIKISYPENNSVINLSKNDTIKLIGSVTTPLFQSYLLRIKKDNNKDQWDTLIPIQYEAKINEVIGKFYSKKISNLLENYTISLLVNLKNGNTLEVRNTIKFCSDENGIKINKLNILQPFFYEKRLPIVNIQTNTECNALVFYKIKDTDTPYKTISSNTYYTKNHIVALNNIPTNIDIEGYVLAILTNADTIRQEFNFNLSNDYFYEYNFYKKEYELPRSYIYDKIINIKNDNESYISLNTLSENLEIEYPKIYKYNAETKNFICIDSTQSREITVANGDSNGDNIPELLAGANGHYKLFQKNTNSSIYDNILFQTNIEKTLWAEGMCDIDGDNKQELIFVDNEYSFYIYSYENNEYKLKLTKNINDFMNLIVIDSLKNTYRIKSGFAIGDFDNDNKIEFGITTYNNDYLLILEIDKDFNTRLKDYKKLENYYHIPNSHFITTGDFDNDGKTDILYMYYGKCDDGENVLGENEIWTYYLFKYDENNNLIKACEDDIYGVRISNLEQGVYFRNGLSSGNLNNILGDEAVICTFPNLYILTWNDKQNKLIPLWSYPTSITNKAIIYDFDNNGKTEIGFSTFSSTSFFEFDNNYKEGTEIINFDGWALTSESVYFKWDIQNNEINENVNYELWLIETKKLLEKDVSFDIYKTKQNFIQIDKLFPNTKYTAYVKISQDENYFSSPIEVYLTEQTKAINASYKYNNLIEVKFTGLLPYEVNSGCFILSSIDNNNKSILISSTTVITDSTIILDINSTLPNGIYKLHILSFRDFYKNYTNDTILIFNINNTIKKELFLTRLEFKKPNYVTLEFSEVIDKITATLISNYTIVPKCNIDSINLVDSTKIELFLSTHSLLGLGKDYLITASNNIIAKNGNRMTNGAGNTLGFTIAEENLNKICVYPNPIRLSKNDEAYIGRLTQKAKIEIMTLEGKILNKLEELDGNGGINWNLRDLFGNILTPGIYILKVIDEISNSEHYTKFTIIK